MEESIVYYPNVGSCLLKLITIVLGMGLLAILIIGVVIGMVIVSGLY